MAKKTPFDRFAPVVLQTYHHDKEAFWEAVMAPFLKNQVSFLAWLGHLRVDVRLFSAFRGLDAQARKVLLEFGAPLGVDISAWSSNRLQYFKDAYPVFAFLAVWMDERKLTSYLTDFGEILRAGVYAVAGYGILDANVDSQTPRAVEVLVAQALIAEYETLALRIFGISDANLAIMQKMRRLFLGAEIREKSLRGVASPYRLDKPEELGTKGANSVTPFMLSLERLGKAAQIDDYWEVFLLFGAAIQMIDDWNDLEGDLTAGHFSYLTLGFAGLDGHFDPQDVARRLRSDQSRVHETYARSKEMLARSREILLRLEDPILVRLVDVTEARVETFFNYDLRMV